MNMFTENDYRTIIRRCIEERKKTEPTYNFQELAKKMRIQKAYLSRVISGKAHFSSDQLFLACQFLNFNEEEKEYLFLLLEIAKSGLEDRKKQLMKKIDSFQVKYLVTKKFLSEKTFSGSSLDFIDYYLNPLNQIVHICLSINRFRADLKQIAKELHVPLDKIIFSVHQLEKMGIIEKTKNDQYVNRIKNLHLPKDSKIYQSWLNQIRFFGLMQSHHISQDNKYNFTAIFSGNSILRKKIQIKLLEFIKEIEPTIKDSRPSGIYQLNLDVFSLTEEN